MRICPRSCVLMLAVVAAAAVLAGCSTQPRVVAVQRFAPQRSTPGPSAQRPGYYQVVAGDTLYSIAFRHQMDYRELARINGIGPPYTIYPGQELRLHGAPVAVRPVPAEVAASKPAVAPTATTPVAAAAVPVAGESWPAPPPAASRTPPAPARIASAPSVVAATPVAGAGPTRRVDGIDWRWPVQGPVLDGFHTDEPGRQGLDIGGRMGQPVYAAASGVVVYSGSGLTGYGELIIIKHNDNYLSAYGHNSVRLVKEGQRVQAGQEIAEMGSTGAPRVELHFEIRKDGKPLDPLDFLPKR